MCFICMYVRMCVLACVCALYARVYMGMFDIYLCEYKVLEQVQFVLIYPCVQWYPLWRCTARCSVIFGAP